MVDKLDLFFDDVIRNYPAATQDLLRRMYYEDNGIVIQEDLLKEGTQAYWEGDREGEEITYRMVVDERIAKCPILLRMNKLHEIAGHIGQFHQAVSQAGVDDVLQEHGNGQFRVFMEQSVTLNEKMLLHAIPESIMDEDLSSLGEPDRTTIKWDITDRKHLSVDDYVRLKHRSTEGNLPNDAKHSVFLCRPDVRAFMQDVIY
ncbi:MAG TPA: hypothetical protein VER36_10015 [Flavisolibacter sp.]|nr:hypothetical protein [Flavisolibacter sp.]